MASKAPNPSPTNASAPAAPSNNATSSNTGPPVATSSGNSNTQTGAQSGVDANGVRITERILSDASWPSDLTLDLDKFNWQEWRRCMDLLALRQGFKPWLDGSLKCPDKQLYPAAHWVWQQNDDSLRGFILEHISPTDFALVNNFPTSHKIFEAMGEHHEKLGVYAKINLMKAFRVKFDYNSSLTNTIAELRDLHDRIIEIGEIDDDELLTVLLVNALGDQFGHLRSTIQTISTSPG